MLIGTGIPFERNKKLNEYAKLLKRKPSKMRFARSLALSAAHPFGMRGALVQRGLSDKKVRKRVGKIAKGVVKGVSKVIRYVPRPLWDAAATAAGTFFGAPEAGYLAGEVIRAGARKFAGDTDEPVQKKQMDEAIGSVVSRGMKRASRDVFGSYMDEFRKRVGAPGVPRYWHNTYDPERLGPRIGPHARTGAAGMDWEEPPVWPDPEPMSEGYVSSRGTRAMSHKSYSSEPYSRMDYSTRSYGSKPMSFRQPSPRGTKRKHLSPKVKKKLSARRALAYAAELRDRIPFTEL